MCFIICTTTWCTCQWEVGIIGTTLVWRPIRTIPAMTYTRVRPYKLKTRNLLVRIFLIQHSTLTCWIGQVLGHSMTINWWTGTSPIGIWKNKQILLLSNTSHMSTGLNQKFNTTLFVEFSWYKIQHLHAGLGKCWATVWPLIGELAIVPLESEYISKFYF